MESYDRATYGDRIAEVYDRWYGGMEVDAVVDFLAECAGDGPVLELGIGTGRIALPLQARGVDVHGIDSSEAMVEKLRAKTGGKRIRVWLGDFADVDVPGRYTLIYIPFNTIFALTTQEEQLRCFRNAAEHLVDGGALVFDAFVPDLERFERGQRLAVESLATEGVRLEASVHDAVSQRVTSRHVVITEQGIRVYPLVLRYAWPSELDLMARLAGLTLRERWCTWRRQPFDNASVSHVSVYERR